MRYVLASLLVFTLGALAFADEFTDCLDRARKAYDAGNFIAAEKEMSRALAFIQPKAKAQIPPPTVHDTTYTNYEIGFRVSAVAKEWRVAALASKPGPDALYPLATMNYVGNDQGDIVIFFMRNLRQFLGSRYETVPGHELDIMHIIGSQNTTLVKNLSDCSPPKHTEIKIAGHLALRSDFTAKRDGVDVRCALIQVIVGEQLFSGIFIATTPDWPTRVQDFDNIVGTMSFDVPIPEPVPQPHAAPKTP